MPFEAAIRRRQPPLRRHFLCYAIIFDAISRDAFQPAAAILRCHKPATFAAYAT
jgi:hypothetical protein